MKDTLTNTFWLTLFLAGLVAYQILAEGLTPDFFIYWTAILWTSYDLRPRRRA